MRIRFSYYNCKQTDITDTYCILAYQLYWGEIDNELLYTSPQLKIHINTRHTVVSIYKIQIWLGL